MSQVREMKVLSSLAHSLGVNDNETWLITSIHMSTFGVRTAGQWRRLQMATAGGELGRLQASCPAALLPLPTLYIVSSSSPYVLVNSYDDF